MNKEMIHNIKKCLIAGYNLNVINQEEMDNLWEYIPNLQKENEELKERIHDLLLDNTDYKLENERLNKQYDLMENSLDRKQGLIDKVIRYIEENCIDDEFYLNLTNKEKHIIVALNMLLGEEEC